MKGHMKKVILLAAVVALVGCKSATLNQGFAIAKAGASILPAVVEDAQGIVNQAKDTYDYARTNILNAAKGSVTTATQ